MTFRLNEHRLYNDDRCPRPQLPVGPHLVSSNIELPATNADNRNEEAR
jgi:hypothetical protein